MIDFHTLDGSPAQGTAVDAARRDLEDYILAQDEGLPVDDDRGPLLSALILIDTAHFLLQQARAWLSRGPWHQLAAGMESRDPRQ